MTLIGLLVVLCIAFMVMNGSTYVYKWLDIPEGTGFFTWLVEKQGGSRDTGRVVDYVVSGLGVLFVASLVNLTPQSWNFAGVPSARLVQTS
jgi:hypothetical protein